MDEYYEWDRTAPAFKATEVRWCEGMKSVWKSKVVRTQPALDKLLEKLAEKGATNIQTRDA